MGDKSLSDGDVLTSSKFGRTGCVDREIGPRIIGGARLTMRSGGAGFSAAAVVHASTRYVFRIVSGDVTTKLPGEPGSGLLP